VEADVSMLPALPTIFATESAIAFARGPIHAMRAAGGSINYGNGNVAPVIHFAITTPYVEDWDLLITVPFVRSTLYDSYYTVDAPHMLWWDWFSDRSFGRHSVAASSATYRAANASFDIVDAPLLSVPTGIAAVKKPNGKVDVTWSPVVGAVSYYASAADLGGYRIGGIWVTTPSASLPSSWFASGSDYEIYIAAADVDMTSSSVPQPNQVAMSENRDAPQLFTYP
jgi:hypothetical protein